ncbi:DUF72 domain-containing protein [Sulfurivermis fontis]|jgi:hypothetical protein|uniref:DUF72 domain-containing protein n=1 Tax=Sulfurivermis fontis TaxID=1972068 RepID=UPI001558715D|nr:DUF72 domain-containing protein [Sulfurivermis fontis]
MYIASLGWDHAGWSGTFYPDDLPPEWRLTYYANEFRAVVVPAALWRRADVATAAQWAADTAEGFRFLLEGADIVPPLELTAALGGRYGGVAGAGGLPVVRWEGGADAATLRGLIEGLPADGVLLVVGAPPSLQVLRTAQTITQLLGRYG